MKYISFNIQKKTNMYRYKTKILFKENIPRVSILKSKIEQILQVLFTIKANIGKIIDIILII